MRVCPETEIARDKLGAAILTNACLRHAVGNDAAEYIGDIFAVDSLITRDGQGLPSVDIEQRQCTQLPAVSQRVGDKIHQTGRIGSHRGIRAQSRQVAFRSENYHGQLLTQGLTHIGPPTRANSLKLR